MESDHFLIFDNICDFLDMFLLQNFHQKTPFERFSKFEFQRTSQAISRKSDGQEQSVYDYDFGPTEYDAKKFFLKIGHFSWFVEGVKIGGSEVKKIFFQFLFKCIHWFLNVTKHIFTTFLTI